MARAKKQEQAQVEMPVNTPRNDMRAVPDEPIKPNNDADAITQVSQLLNPAGVAPEADGDKAASADDGQKLGHATDPQYETDRNASDPDETGASVDDDPESGAGDEVGDGDSGDEPEPITVKALAEKLGVEASDLYDGLEIPLGTDGQHITLGEFKDRVQDLRELDSNLEAFTTEKADYEKGQLRDRQLLQDILGMIDPATAEKCYKLASERLEGWQSDQQTAILEAIPEWKDADNLRAGREAIVKLGSEYGFSETEMTYTQDARTVRMLRDFVAAREQLQAANAEAKRLRKTPNKRGKSNRQTAKRNLAAVLAKAKGSSDNRDQVAGVSALINQG